MTKTIKNLLLWFQDHLHSQGTFTADDLQQFFADSFVIKTNHRIIEATPSTYREYLYELKNRLVSVRYDVEEIIEAPSAVIASFVIHLNFHDRELHLLTISIFKLNAKGKILEWKEVFADAEKPSFSYDI